MVDVGDKSFVPLNALVEDDPNWFVEVPNWLLLLPNRFVEGVSTDEVPGVVPIAPEAEPDWSTELPVPGLPVVGWLIELLELDPGEIPELEPLVPALPELPALPEPPLV